MSDLLRDKFPEMQPITAAPTLSTTNGVGLTMYGKRDFDHETGTYVKTHVFCFLFIPLIALKGYRVADAPTGGWYFLGRVPLSMLAKTWNLLVLLLIVGGAGLGYWTYHTSTEEYKAEQKLDEADQFAAEGQIERAAQLYAEVAGGSTSQVYTAQTKLGELLDSRAAQASPGIAAKVMAVAVAVDQSGRPIDRLLERAQTLAKKHADAKPREALALLDAAAPLERDFKKRIEMRRPLAERFLAQYPDDVEALSEVAQIHEFDRRIDLCEKLLAPHAKKLGQSEGARILGQIYLGKDKLDDAYALLSAYAGDRLKRLHAAQNDLRSTRDPQARQAAQNASRREARVVEPALDLGIVLLRRAQTIPNQDERRKELEKAEEHFLALGGLVGKVGGAADESRLNLGKVKYWLGRHDEGRKLFDEYLEGHAGKSEAVFPVANAMREVGAVSEARSLLEQTYEKEPNPDKRFILAEMRSVMDRDLDDKITWLNRTDLSRAMNKADLRTAEGHRSARAGKDQEAAALYGEAINLIGQIRPPDAATLNNSALVHFDLYQVTGERALLDKGIALLEDAVQLKPSDSILLSNVAFRALSNSLRDLLGDAIDFKILKREPGLDLVGFTYKDNEGWKKTQERMRQHAGLAKARSFYERCRLLAPRNPQHFGLLVIMARMAHDFNTMRELHASLKDTSFDLKDALQFQLDDYQGKHDDKNLKDNQAAVERWKGIVPQARQVGGATFAVAADALIRAQLASDERGRPINLNELLVLAREAHIAAPSMNTEGTVIGVLLHRAHKSLRDKIPAYAALAEGGKRSLPPAYIVAIALLQEGPAQKACLANADVKEVQQMLLARLKVFPKSADEWVWAMLKTAHREQAAKVAENCLKDQEQHLERAIYDKLAPLNAGQAYRQAWALQMAGRGQEADAVLRRLAAQGVPLPLTSKK